MATVLAYVVLFIIYILVVDCHIHPKIYRKLCEGGYGSRDMYKIGALLQSLTWLCSLRLYSVFQLF